MKGCKVTTFQVKNLLFAYCIAKKTHRVGCISLDSAKIGSHCALSDMIAALDSE